MSGRLLVAALALLAADDADAIGSNPADYAAFIRKEQERWSKVVRTANIKAD